MITLARFRNVEDAYVLRTFLIEEGIFTSVLDEHFIQWPWHHSDALGGVRVVVHEGQGEEAMPAYRRYQEIQKSSPSPASVVRCWPLVLFFSYIFGAPALLFGRRQVPIEPSSKPPSAL